MRQQGLALPSLSTLWIAPAQPLPFSLHLMGVAGGPFLEPLQPGWPDLDCSDARDPFGWTLLW
jgi:hypothetical protein